MNEQIVFSKETGNANNYRIPSLVATTNNTIVACCDERFFTGSDNPNRIDKVIRISNDNGETWSEQITAVKECGKDKEHSSSAVDPAMLYDKDTATLHMIYSHTPAGVGILNCARATGYDKNGNKLFVLGRKKLSLIGDELYHKGKAIGIKVDENGQLSDGSGCVYDGSAPIREMGTSFLYHTISKDNGKTWEKPTCLNLQVKNPGWGFIGACPGNGLKTSKNRLIFPVYYGVNKAPLSLTFATMYSDDGGATWKIGKTPKMGGRFPKNNPILIVNSCMLTETQIIELPDGTLKAFIRNHKPQRRILIATSTNGGETWSDPVFHNELPHPICQISAISFVHEGKFYVLTINASSTKKRERGVIRLSEDEGKTFPYEYVLTKGEFVYSSAQYLSDGTIGILFEDSTQHENIKFTKITIDQITGV